MIHITYKKKGIRITQIWFPNEIIEQDFMQKTDVLFYHGVSEQIRDGSLYQTFHTLMSDLTQPEEDQYACINKNVRYEIRRNQKEDVVFEVFSSKKILEDERLLAEFAHMYEAMYEEKGMKQSLNMEQLKLYAHENALVISMMRMGEQPIVIHSYIVDDKHVRLLHSVSEFRKQDMDANMVARCNKRLHWEDMCYFSKEGKAEYDWGGVSSLDNPNGIDAFKFKFGGTPCTYYNKYQSKSVLGKMVVDILKLRQARSKH